MNNKEQKVEPTTENGNSTKPLVVGSAYLVTVGCKSGVYRVIVLAKTEAECMNKVQLNFKDYEWQDVRECFGKPLS